MAAIADGLAHVTPANGMGGILDDAKAIAPGQGGDGRQVAGLASEVYRDHHLGQPALALCLFQLDGQGRGVEVVGVRVDVDEVHPGAAITPAIGGGDEGVGGGPQPVARPQPQGQAGEVQGAGGGVDRYAVGGATVGGDRLLEPRHRWALGEEIRAQHGGDRGDIGLGDGLATVGDHGAGSGAAFREPWSWMGVVVRWPVWKTTGG